MKVTTREARSRFASILNAAEQGEPVEITRHGRVVARLTRPEAEVSHQARRDERRQLRAQLPAARESATDTVRELREER